MASDAFSAASFGLGKAAPAVGTPRSYLAPKPNEVAAAAMAASARLAERVTNAVLQDWAKAERKVVPPSDPPSKWRSVWPPTVASAGHATGVSGRVPPARSAAVVTTLNVDAGGYWPASA